MPYYLRGKLCGYICRECPRPLWGVIVRAYAAEDANLVQRAVANPKSTAAALDEKAVKARAGRLLAEAIVGEDGSFEIAFDQKSRYKGGPVELDVRMEGVPKIDERTAKAAPRQVHLTTLQPAWREREKDRIAYWEYCLPPRLWCLILSWYDIWVICGRVTICATGAPVGGVVVKAFDRDWLQDDALGSAMTDATGRFVIYYMGADFRETIFSPFINVESVGGPDLYFLVETTIGTPLLVEPPSRARQPDRENVGNCFCVELCLDKQPPVNEPLPVFTHVGGYHFLSQIDSTPSGSSDGLTVGDNRAFYATNRLNGILSKTLNGLPMEYRFEYRTTDPNGFSPGPWQPVTPAMIARTSIGLWQVWAPAFPGDPNPIKVRDYVVHGVGPGEKVVAFNGNWIQVPQESDTFDPSVGYFQPNGNMINLITPMLAAFPSLNMAGKVAGSSTGPTFAANKHFSLRMIVRQVNDSTTETQAGLLEHYAVNNTGYDNVQHHPSWAGYTSPPGTIGVCLLDIQELITNGCAEIQNTLTVLVTAAHPTLGAVSLSMMGNAFSGTFTLPAPVPGELFGTATNNFVVADLQPCAYIVTLSTQLLLTTGDNVPSNLIDQIAFCKAPPP